ncbi:MAG: outer membrane lipoprotein-sorting protein [Gammaproteobacteria bacterium]|nr:outer membrane lipoprotein-sorting protein [Gammaproteobacteria bacterium]
MKKTGLLFLLYLWMLFFSQGVIAQSARDIIKGAIDNFRGLSSYSEATMVIHRPDWERSMEMKIWTQGMDKSLVRITAPKKDLGNGTLLIDDDMWSYSPKINRVIKIPSSMATQSWMGSDFSNNDVSRADDIVDQYQHTLLETSEHEGIKLYTIKSVPHDDAPVVWGREVLRIRDDYVLLSHAFYDQDGALVKTLETRDIQTIDGRNVATIERMTRADKPDEWTEFRMANIKFNITIQDNTFTLSSLRNPRF